MKIYDVIIIGSGPAGLTAGIYATRAGLTTLLLEKENFGGYVSNIDFLENYPGFSKGIRGADLAHNMVEQARNFGVEFGFGESSGVEIVQDNKVVKTIQEDFIGRTLIIASGSRHKKLNVPGENEFIGKGVAYCGVCEGGRFSNKVVAVVGGGDAGITEALYLSKMASKIIVLEAMPKLKAAEILQKRAMSNSKIEIRCKTQIKAIAGEDKVNKLEIVDSDGGKPSILNVEGVFIHIGLDPNSDFLKGALPLNSIGQILVNNELETRIPGCFAAGDVRDSSKGQVITAAGDGATAALSVINFLMKSSDSKKNIIDLLEA